MTKAFDVATIFYALLTLEKEFLGKDRKWIAQNKKQKQLFEIYAAYKDVLPRIKNLKALASIDWQALNAFLTSEKFNPMFDGPLDGIGVVSILDKFVQWMEKGKECTIKSHGKVYPGFELKGRNFNVYRVKHAQQPLIELITQSDDQLFLMMNEESMDGLEMFDMAVEIMARRNLAGDLYAAIQIPKVDFDIKPDISFLAGANTLDLKKRFWFIAQALQQFKFRMNEKGARAKVATGMLLSRGISFEPEQKLIFDKPFLGWFIQRGIKLPLAIFHSHQDSWKEPTGTLEEL